MRILIVDADGPIRQLYREMLDNPTVVVVGVSEVSLAWSMLENSVRFDVVVFDHPSEKINTPNFVRRTWNKLGRDGSPKFVVTAASGGDEMEEFCRNEKIPLLQKPFSREDLLKVIADIAEK